MRFNSLTFLIFFAAVLGLYYLPFSWRQRKINLLLASYLFYAAWNPPFVTLLWISTLADWFLAKSIHQSSNQRARRWLLAASLGVNLGLLGFFKYSGFALDNFTALVQTLGFDFTPARPDIILPVGISFYTFQTLSYTLDVYRGKIGPWHSFLDYALYVTFFPQLVAGPIVRAVDFLPQCDEPKRAAPGALSWGLSLLVLGLFQKIVLADSLLAPAAESLFSNTAAPGFAAAWTGALAFSGQILYDFAGYSTCAIGVALCLGFSLPDNFRFPYAAVGFSDFWRRWHISLSSWLRDYLYISLGGNRKSPTRTLINLMATMLLGGLWHGASWTFVAWGGLHGLYLVIERLLKAVVPQSLQPKTPGRLILALITFALVTVTWVFFRARTFPQAFVIVRAMFGLGPGSDGLALAGAEAGLVLLVILLTLAVHWLMRDTSIEEAAGACPWPVKTVLLAVMILLMMAMPGEDRAFIYFQF